MAATITKLIRRYNTTAAVASANGIPPWVRASSNAPSTTPTPPGIKGKLEAAIPPT